MGLLVIKITKEQSVGDKSNTNTKGEVIREIISILLVPWK